MSILKNVKKIRKNKKGFTLVELIVVLVILAILLAILVPSLVGWIDKAKEKQVLVEGRSVYLAAQGVASEKYGKDSSTDTDMLTYLTGDGMTEIKELSEAEGVITITEVKNGKITKMTYTSGGKTATLTGKTWKVEKTPSTS